MLVPIGPSGGATPSGGGGMGGGMGTQGALWPPMGSHGIVLAENMDTAAAPRAAMAHCV